MKQLPEQTKHEPNDKQQALLALLKTAKLPTSTSACSWVTFEGEAHLAIPISNKSRAAGFVISFIGAHGVKHFIDDQAASRLLIKEQCAMQLEDDLKGDPKGWSEYVTIIENVSSLLSNKAGYYCKESFSIDERAVNTYEFIINSGVAMLVKMLGKDVVVVEHALGCYLQLNKLAVATPEKRKAIQQRIAGQVNHWNELREKIKQFSKLCPFLLGNGAYYKNDQVRLEVCAQDADVLAPLFEFLGAKKDHDIYLVPIAIFTTKGFMRNVKKKVAECEKQMHSRGTASSQKRPLTVAQKASPASADEAALTATLSKALLRSKTPGAEKLMEFEWVTVAQERFFTIYSAPELILAIVAFLESHDLVIDRSREVTSLRISKAIASQLSSILADDRHAFAHYVEMLDLIPTCLDKSTYVSMHKITSDQLVLWLTRPELSGLSLLLQKPFTIKKADKKKRLEATFPVRSVTEVTFNQFEISLRSLIRMPLIDRINLIISLKKFIKEWETLFSRVKDFVFFKLGPLCSIGKEIMMSEGGIILTMPEKTGLLIEPIFVKMGAVRVSNKYVVPIENFAQFGEGQLESLYHEIEERVHNLEEFIGLLRKIGPCKIDLRYEQIKLAYQNRQDHECFQSILSACNVTFEYDMFFATDHRVLARLQLECDKQLKARAELRKVKLSLMCALESWLPNRSAWTESEGVFRAANVEPMCVLALTRLAIPGLTVTSNPDVTVSIPLVSLLALQDTHFSSIQEATITAKRKLQIVMAMVRRVRKTARLEYMTDGFAFRFESAEAKTLFIEHGVDLLQDDAADNDQRVVLYERILEQDLETLSARLAILEKTFKQDHTEIKTSAPAPAARITPPQVKPAAQHKTRPKKPNKKKQNKNKAKKKATSTVTAPPARSAKPVASGPRVGSQPARDYGILDRPSLGEVLDLEAFLNINPDQLDIVHVAPEQQSQSARKPAPNPMYLLAPAQPDNVHEATIQEELMNMRNYYAQWKAIAKESRQRKDVHYKIVCRALNLSLKRLLNAVHLRLHENPFCRQLSKDGDELAWKVRNILMHQFPELREVKRLYKMLEREDIGAVVNCIMSHRQPPKPLLFGTYSQGFFHCPDVIDHKQTIIDLLLQLRQMLQLHDAPTFKAFSEHTLIKSMQACIVDLGTLAKYLRLTQGLSNDIWKFVISCKELRNDTGHNNVDDEATGFDPLSAEIVLQHIRKGLAPLRFAEPKLDDQSQATRKLSY